MDSCNNPPKIGILGAGVSGMCAAIQLRKQLNINTFTLFDENHDVGGTWLVNTYPGCACDVPSHLFSYSFEPNPNWSKTYSGQQEILEYLQNVARKYDLYPKIKFQHKVMSAEWNETNCKWRVIVINKEGVEETHTFDIVVSGIGALRIANLPEQFDPFCKPKIHSAQWDRTVELENKVVAVVGSGASAVQIIPEIVNKVKRLIVYQRRPPWVIPKMQMEIPSFVKWTFAHIPGVQWTLRNVIFWSHELFHPAFKKDTLLSRLAVKLGEYHLNRQVSDPETRDKLLPKYKFGCKRITPSNHYYPALTQDHVTIVSSKITDVTEDSIVTEDGTSEIPDVLILATGFRVQDFFAPLEIKGKGGEDLLRKWKKSGPCAYGGIACHLTPNAFFLLGPNTGLGHNGVIFSIECQVNWMIQVIREMSRRNARTATIKKSAEDKYMSDLLTSMKSTVWGSTNCGSWYADHRGVVTALWPESLLSYYNHLKTADFSQIEFTR